VLHQIYLFLSMDLPSLTSKSWFYTN